MQINVLMFTRARSLESTVISCTSGREMRTIQHKTALHYDHAPSALNMLDQTGDGVGSLA